MERSIKLLARELKDFILKSQGNLTVLTGAGCSTDSGIPDYRGEKGAYVINKNYKPITFQQFINDIKRRRRYWVRSFFGYLEFSKASPNNSHNFLSFLEAEKKIKSIITQNVDNLHFKAGNKKIFEIHGNLNSVYCLNCLHEMSRIGYQNLLSEKNWKWHDYLSKLKGEKPINTPDGDIILPDSTDYTSFNIQDCINCKVGFYKPNIIFFGENIKNEFKKSVQEEIMNSKNLLIIGSSLQTPSAYRLVEQAYKNGTNIRLINLGPTRCDQIIKHKYNVNCTKLLMETYNQFKN